MIRIKDKDVLLAYILASGKERYVIEYKEVFPDHEVEEFEFYLMLEQFQKMKLLESTKRMSGGASFIRISASIYDFFRHGGFAAQEELLRSNIEKLGYELDELSKSTDKSVLERVGRISQIAASVIKALGLFSDKE